MRSDNSQFKGATVAAHYGAKPLELHNWLTNLQKTVGETLIGFRPRPISEIHATIVGLEFRTRLVTEADLAALLQFLVDATRDGFDVQFGGYLPGSTTFRSRNREPYERSFGIDAQSCVLIGWPDPIDTIATLRRGVEPNGFRHRYHNRPTDLDTDLYIVLGEYDGDSQQDTFLVRQYLADNPYCARWNTTDLSVIMYRSASLAQEGSMSVPLLAALDSSTLGIICKIIENSAS